MDLVHQLLYSLPITVTPEPPPGIGEAVSRVLSWLYWLSWVAVLGAGFYGVLKIVTGDSDEGRRLIISAIVGGVLLAFLWLILSALIS